MADNFDLQGWMREQKQGPYAGPKGVEKVELKSSKPKSKTGLNESLMGMIDLKPIGSLSEEYDETYEGDDIPENPEDPTSQPGYIHEDASIADKWDMIPGDEKEAMLDAVDDAEEGLADYAYMGWAMVPDEVKAKIADTVMAVKVAEPEPDEDEKMAAMAMKQAKKGAKAVKGLNPEKDIYDLLYGDEEDDNF
jgi:hypothetical protein